MNQEKIINDETNTLSTLIPTPNTLTLGNREVFELVEYWPAAISAGYSQDDIQRCVVYSGPTFDDENFYYCAYFGNPLLALIKSSILVCRKKSDRSFVYAINCQTYSRDIGHTYLGAPQMICRPAPVINGNKLYLVSGWVTNIGPQLFCINKYTGQLMYAVAYNLPYEVKQELGVKQITEKNDYSRFKGGNCMINNLGPIVKGKKIYLGTSSLQNAYNVGLTPGNPNFSGYPYYTDQGSLSCVKEKVDSDGNIYPIVKNQTEICAPPFRIGDKLVKNNPKKNPFLPGEDKVLIATVTDCKIISPGAISGAYNIAQKALLSSTTIINNSLFAQFWQNVGNIIYLTDQNSITTGPHTFSAIISILLSVVLGPIAVPFTLSSSVTDISMVNGAVVTGQLGVWYVKELSVGHVIDNKYDANALGYWGNAVWGDTPYIDNYKILFGTGQSHSSPLSERLYFSHPDRNYRLLKMHLIDLINQYVLDPSNPKLQTINAEKISFCTKIRNLSVLDVRSPRGQMSYSDTIVATNPKTLDMLYAVRSVPSDVYNFLSKNDPLVVFPIPSVDIDGDLSSGIYQNNGLVSAVGKHGAGCVIDVSGYNGNQWNHTTPYSVGVTYIHNVYIGPNGTLGGTNYSSSFSKSKSMIVGLTTNGLFSSGSEGSDGQLEKMLTSSGLYVPAGNSVAYGFEYDQYSATVKWYTPLNGPQCGATTVHKNHALTCDGNGSLYLVRLSDGIIIQTIDASTDPFPMLGGIARPAIDKQESKVYWIASYNLPLPPFDNPIRKYGWIVDLN